MKLVELTEQKLKDQLLGDVIEHCIGKLFDIKSHYIMVHLSSPTIKGIDAITD